MNNKLKSLIVVFVIILLPIGAVLSWPSEFQNATFGTQHGPSCHHNKGPDYYSASGKVTLTSTEQTVGPGEEITVSAKIESFQEAQDKTVAVGFLSGVAHNDDFKFSPTEITGISLDGNGDDPLIQTFTVTAPSKAGDYEITAYALWGGDGGPSGAVPLAYATGSLIITVVLKVPTSYISAANYLVNIADKSNGGYRWEDSNNSAVYASGWGKGAAGVGDFLLEAFNKSGNSLYLNYSKGAARWLWSVRHIDGNGTHWSLGYNVDNSRLGPLNYTGIFMGAAGIGRFFLNLYSYTYNTTYRDWAEEIAQYLKNEDSVADPNEMAWAEKEGDSYISNEYLKGTPGIGVFFMDLEDTTSNTTYGQWALNVSRYLINAADTSGIGATWKNNNSPSASNKTGIWEGTAGIGDYLLDIWKKYGNNTAYSYANKTFDWLNSTRKSGSLGGYFWDHIDGDGEDYTSFGKGVAGISTFLFRLANITGNATHLTLAQEALDYLVSSVNITSQTYWWNESSSSPYQYVGKGRGMAGIGEAFLYALNYTISASYEDNVEGIYTWLAKTELRDDLNDTYSTGWRQSTQSSEINKRSSGIFDGAAGVGFFLLKRAEYLNDTIAPIRADFEIPIVSGTSVILKVSNAVDQESGINSTAFYIDGEVKPYLFNGTEGTIPLSAGSHNVYAIVFDQVGNPFKNSTIYTFTIRSTTLPDDEDDGSRDLWKEPDIYVYFYYGAIFTIIGVVAIILLTKIRFRHVSYSKPKRK